MKKIAICIAMIMALAPVLVIAGSDDASAEPVNESFSGLMADIYIFNVDDLTHSISISDGEVVVMSFKTGGANDTAMKEAIDNGTDPSSIVSDYTDYGLGPATVYVFHIHKYSSGNPNITLNGSVKYLNGIIPYKAIPETYLTSGQSVKMNVTYSGGGTLCWGKFGGEDYRYAVLGESELEISMSEYYSVYSESYGGSLSTIYVSYTIEYEPLPESNATMGYVALILGIVLIVPLFAFGLRQRIRIDNSNGQDSVWMEDVEESEEKPKSGLFRKKE